MVWPFFVLIGWWTPTETDIILSDSKTAYLLISSDKNCILQIK
jgi:hypothetical protein